MKFYNHHATPHGESINTMKMVREIRDELSELYRKNPVAYIQETNKIANEFIEKARNRAK
jgi:hypothetical protein